MIPVTLTLVGGACGSCESSSSTSSTPDSPAGSGGGGATASSADTGTGGGFLPSGTSGSGGGAGGGGFEECGAAGECPESTLCKYGKCIPDLGPCTTNDTCPGDSYCDQDGTCVPYGVPSEKVNDPGCEKHPELDITPTVQCEWDGTVAGDPTSAYVNVYSAPMVADLNLDLDPNRLQPSIVATTWATVSGERVGMLRVFDGRTCAEQLRIGGPDDPDVALDRPAFAAQWAIGDLDRDVGQPNGHPEIVGLHRTEAPLGQTLAPGVALIAYEIDSTVSPPVLRRKWHGRECGTSGPSSTSVVFGSALAEFGPGLWDLDDDGVPEIVLDTAVFNADGCLLNAPVAYDPYLVQSNGSKGMLSTVADVDLDDKPDLVRYDGVYGWNTTDQQWERKPWFVPDTAAHRPGHVAIVDAGRYSELPGVTSDRPLPEVIVVSAQSSSFNANSTGSVRVQTLTGEVVFGPIPLHHVTSEHGGHGGPPTASDFDGDGWPEFAAAANEFYTVYDPDCVAGGDPSRPGGQCARPASTDLPDFVLWAQPSRDFSSSITGSSIFDFDGDKRAEAVYHDECYLRVYDGATGAVLFSAPRASGTGTELPVIVDVDGDFATEIVAARALNAPTCQSPDPLFPGSGSYVQKGGVVVYRDPEDRWASSRPIWNQHAYSVTHVNDDATLPASSQVGRNWETPGLNNFRQNVQGDNALALADLTVELFDLQGLCAGQSGSLPVNARVCNRGTAAVQDGARVEFYATPQGEMLEDGHQVALCEAVTSTLLQVGECTVVSCMGVLPADHDVWIVVDPDRDIADCHPGNNAGASALALCPTVN